MTLRSLGEIMYVQGRNAVRSKLQVNGIQYVNFRSAKAEPSGLTVAEPTHTKVE